MKSFLFVFGSKKPTQNIGHKLFFFLSFFLSLNSVFLGWQLKLLSLEHFCDVEIEEVTVQDGLHAASHDGDDVVKALKRQKNN